MSKQKQQKETIELIISIHKIIDNIKQINW